MPNRFRVALVRLLRNRGRFFARAIDNRHKIRTSYEC